MPLELAKVDWAVDMLTRSFSTNSFSGLKRTDGNGTQTVSSLPFHIVMKVRDGAGARPPGGREAEGHVPRPGVQRGPLWAFAGALHAIHRDPDPEAPDVAYVGSEGEPFSSSFRLNFTVTNSNSFPIALTSVKTFLEISGRKYSLLHTRKSVDVRPG